MTDEDEREPQDGSAAEAPLLFCPFCKECYEGIAQCPDHELTLVPFDALPRDAEEDSLPGDEDRLVGFDPRFGRGIVALGVALMLGSFAAPMMEVTTTTQSRVFSAYAAALTNAPNLWTIPFVAAMFVAFLARRRTPSELRGARAAGVALSLTPFVSMAYSWWRVTTGAATLTERSGQLIEIHAHWGFVMTSVACLVLLWGSLRLGIYPQRALRGLPSADPHFDPREAGEASTASEASMADEDEAPSAAAARKKSKRRRR